MNGKQVGFIVGAVLLLLACLPLIIYGSLTLTASNLVSEITGGQTGNEGDLFPSDLNKSIDIVGGIEIGVGILALGGGITCAVFASKQ